MSTNDKKPKAEDKDTKPAPKPIKETKAEPKKNTIKETKKLEPKKNATKIAPKIAPKKITKLPPKHVILKNQKNIR